MPRLSSVSVASSRAEYPVNGDPPVSLLSVLDVADRPTAVNSLRFTGTVLPDTVVLLLVMWEMLVIYDKV